jgi:hypothetical protein
MKRGRPPLFVDTEPPTYVVDTSAWVDIPDRPDADDVWALVYALVKAGQIIVSRRVAGELRRQPFYWTHLKPQEPAISAGDRDDIDYLLHVGRITHKYPAMSHARGTKTPADPWVVALADMERYTVVCNESRKRRNRKIPGVCDQRGIRCLTLDEFIAEVRAEGLIA